MTETQTERTFVLAMLFVIITGLVAGMLNGDSLGVCIAKAGFAVLLWLSVIFTIALVQQ